LCGRNNFSILLGTIPCLPLSGCGAVLTKFFGVHGPGLPAARQPYIEPGTMTAMRISILYPGDMGTAIAAELRAAGHAICTYVTERGPRTRDNAQAAGFHLKEDLPAALEQADLILSLVPPGEAINTALRVATALGDAQAPIGDRVYLDLNSVSPATMREVARIVTGAGARCIDGTIHGQAARLREKSVLLLSGPGAGDLRPLFEGFMPVRTLGDEIGAASSLKMCLGSFTKGLIALSSEIFTAAGRGGQHTEFVSCLTDFYPETAQLIARLLPSYPKHVARRVQEMGEVGAWQEEIGVVNNMTQATQEILEKMLSANIDPNKTWEFEELLEQLVHSNAFRIKPD
jgi:3-hydroxyisobutyrate dehydrogenase-like beta-hydroxyacid dehydrogenase